MKQERDDKIGRALADAIQRRHSTNPCPDMDRFAAAVDDKLPEADQDDFRTHLAACPRCLEAYTAACELAHDIVQPGSQLTRWSWWGGSLVAVTAVAILAIRLSQEPQMTSPQVATAPPPEAVRITPTDIHSKPHPVTKKSTTPVSSPLPKQTLLAFADADDFWNSAVSGRVEIPVQPRYKVRGIPMEPPVMSGSSSVVPESTVDTERPPPPHIVPLHAFQIGVSLRQIQRAQNEGDHVALDDRYLVIAKMLEAAGQHNAGSELNSDRLEILRSLPHVRLGVWAESVREALVKNDQHDMTSLIIDSDSLLALDFSSRITAGLTHIRSELDAEGATADVKREVILKLLTEIVADL